MDVDVKYIIFQIIFILSVFTEVGADDWSFGTEAGTDSNKIIKWCSNNGGAARYASANITIKGYKPCGELVASKTCDATGMRFIGKSAKKDSPYGYLDCEKGNKRIFIERIDTDLKYADEIKNPKPIENSSMSNLLDFKDYGSGSKVTAMTASEKRKLRKDLTKIENSGGLEKQLERILIPILDNLNTLTDPSKMPRKSKNPDASMKNLENIIKQLDPQAWKDLQKRLKP